MFAAIDARGLDPKQKGDGYTSRCPAHDDETPSFSFGPGENGNVVQKCWTGCTFDAVCAGLGLPSSAFFAEKNGHAPPRKKALTFLADWVIRDAEGTPLAVHRKFLKPNGKKTFLWFMADGVTPSKSGTDHALDSDALPLYGVHRLPPDAAVVITEGEKACDALHDAGVVALGTVCGASSLPGAQALEVLRGRGVTIWPDNDTPGRKHAAALGRALQGIAKSVHVVEWTSDPPPRDRDDAFDFIAAKGDIPALLDAARPLEAPPSDVTACADEPHTDLGLARRFAFLHQSEFRYVADLETWVRWDGNCWRPDVTNRAVYIVCATTGKKFSAVEV